jgi:hypothetical protein
MSSHGEKLRVKLEEGSTHPKDAIKVNGVNAYHYYIGLEGLSE